MDGADKGLQREEKPEAALAGEYVGPEGLMHCRVCHAPDSAGSGCGTEKGLCRVCAGVRRKSESAGRGRWRKRNGCAGSGI